jgi:hypothetical protein
VFIVVDWHMYFCRLAWLFFLFGRVYYCWLNVCIVVGFPCVFVNVWLCLLLFFAYKILLVGGEYCCWLTVCIVVV